VSSSTHTLIVKGTVNFGNIDANATITSTDTYTIRQDRRFAFDPESLSWTFSSSQAPQSPIAVASATSTTIPVGGAVHLDGSQSSDPGGHALTYHWTLTTPT